jgi:methyl-accepting chemotaxis protein
MDTATQQNAALVEEASAAAQSMQDQAAQLAQAVSVFKLDGIQGLAAKPVVSPPSIHAERLATAPVMVAVGTMP